MIISIIPLAGASDIFDILDEKYIIDISELPSSSGNPEINWQKQGHIEAWVDIIGFKNLTKENGVYFINRDPASLAIVQYDSKGKVSGVIDSITNSLSLSTIEGNLIASLTVVLKWHVICCNKDGCWVCGRYTETKTFQDTEFSPEQCPNIAYTTNITEYNNSVNPRTVIGLTTYNSYINYTYKNESIKNYLKTARVEQTSKGIYFANLSSANIWTEGIGSFHQMDDKAIIRGTADPDYDNLSITVSNIYETKRVSNYSIVRDTYKFERSFSGLYITLIIIFGILIGTLYYTAKRALS
jgi:hypothetical protein